jgi:hypothetical protein
MVWSKSPSTFLQISKNIHFMDNEARPADCDDRLYNVRPVLNSLVTKFEDVYVPEQQILIDEGMIAWKQRLIFRVYMPDKLDRYVIKAYLVQSPRVATYVVWKCILANHN